MAQDSAKNVAGELEKVEGAVRTLRSRKQGLTLLAKINSAEYQKKISAEIAEQKALAATLERDVLASLAARTSFNLLKVDQAISAEYLFQFLKQDFLSVCKKAELDPKHFQEIEKL